MLCNHWLSRRCTSTGCLRLIGWGGAWRYLTKTGIKGSLCRFMGTVEQPTSSFDRELKNWQVKKEKEQKREEAQEEDFPHCTWKHYLVKLFRKFKLVTGCRICSCSNCSERVQKQTLFWDVFFAQFGQERKIRCLWR